MYAHVNRKKRISLHQQYPSILPQTKLPIFDGTLKNWISFRDTFVSLVQNNESLSNLQKFYYLRGLLKDYAARTIQSLGVSEENYKLVWQSLQIRYERTVDLSNYHAGTFLDLIRNRSCIALRKFIDDAKNRFLTLRKLDELVELWDIIVLVILVIVIIQ